MLFERLEISRRHLVRAAALGTTAAAAGCAGGGVNILGVNVSGKDFQALGSMWSAFTMNDEDEKELGREAYGPLIDQTGGAYANRAVQADMERFAMRTFETTTRPFDWEVVVVDNDEPNAWALAGGKVAVNKGLLRYVDNEHELAAVVSHEMGHAEESHHVSELRRQSGAEVAGRAAGKGAEVAFDGAVGEIAGLAVTELFKGVAKIALFGYSRGAEVEADEHILTTFDATEHDPQRATGFYKTLLELVPESSESTTSLFAGHPETKKRIAELEEKAGGKSGRSRTAVYDNYAALKRPFPTRRHYRRTPVDVTA